MNIQFHLDEQVTDAGPIEEDKEHVRSEPFSLPDKFYWSNVELADDLQVNATLINTPTCVSFFINVHNCVHIHVEVSINFL